MTILDANTETGGDTDQMTVADELIAGHSDAAINRYKTFDAFVVGHKELEGKLGSAIQPLAADATDEQKRAFHTKFGCPEKVEGYEVTKPDLPEGMQWDEELLKGAAQYAYDNGIPKTVFEGLVKMDTDRRVAQFKQMAEKTKAEKDTAFETSTNELRGKWGAKYDENVERANRFYNLPGDDKVNKAFVDLLESKGIQNHPATVEFMSEAYGLVKVDDIPGGGGGAAGTKPPEGQLSYPKSPNMQKET